MNFLKSKSIKSVLIVLAFLMILMPLINTRQVVLASEKFDGKMNFNCSGNNKCFNVPEVPTSNVSDQEFNNILNNVKKTKEYKQLSKETVINQLAKKDIVINKSEDTVEKLVSVGFIIGEKIGSDNLAYVEIVYDLENKTVFAKKMLYGKAKENGLINIRMVVNDKQAFSMDLNKDGQIIGEDGQVISQEDFYKQAVNDINMSKGGFTTNSWCEWAVGALCGAGGGAACYAIAVGLGLTTGIGGFALATVCGLIGALGCTAATKKICG